MIRIISTTSLVISGLLLAVLGCGVPIEGSDAGPALDGSAGADAALDAGGNTDSGAPDVVMRYDAAQQLFAGAAGRICAPSGDYFIADAEVRVTYEKNFHGAMLTRQRTTTTNARGMFRFTGLPVGTHLFEASFGRLRTWWNATVQEPGGPATLENGVTDIGDNCFPGDGMRLAVVPGWFDSIQDVIDSLGLTEVTMASTSIGWETDFFDLTYLQQFDAIYFNCGLDDYDIDYPTVAAVLNDYVAQGGSVYASDWSYFLIESAFPDAADFYGDDILEDEAQQGASEIITASLIGPTVEKMCGREVEINYDLDSWAVMLSAGEGVETLAQGTVHSLADWSEVEEHADAPLMIRFEPEVDSGRVVYTTFHNEAQATEDMLCILKYVILSM